MAKKKKAKKKPTRKKVKKKPAAREGAESSNSAEQEGVGQQFARMTAPRQLDDAGKRRSWGLSETEFGPGQYIVELNLLHMGGLPEAENKFDMLFRKAIADSDTQWQKAVEEAQKKNAGTKTKLDEAEWKWRSERPPKVRISKTFYRCVMCVIEWRKLIALDEEQAEREAAQAASSSTGGGDQIGLADALSFRAIYRLWPDFPVKAQVDRSVATIKADAAYRAFDAGGSGMTWAVIDSGIAADHLHFDEKGTLVSDSVKDLHRCYADVFETTDSGLRVNRGPLADPDSKPEVNRDELLELIEKHTKEMNRDELLELIEKHTKEMDREDRKELIGKHTKAALSDEFGHGTHVAGIVAGEAPEDEETAIFAFQREFKMDQTGETVVAGFRKRPVRDRKRLRGVAPLCKLVSLKVLDDRGEGRASNVILALEYIREKLNDDPKMLRVHGVNLSVGYEFDAEMFACGQSPLCTEVNRLVQAGVVVVAAAGNTGYGTVGARARATKVGLSNTINDPGNAALAITVGATHRDAPHTYGVSYFSSKGPTGDGRLKPDLVAPGERITSCAAGKKLRAAYGEAAPANGVEAAAHYIDDSGTSMAAPHVSGAIAAFLSVRREFIGKPLDVKRIFLESATSLDRERYFQGHGLVDLMRAIQSV